MINFVLRWLFRPEFFTAEAAPCQQADNGSDASVIRSLVPSRSFYSAMRGYYMVEIWCDNSLRAGRLYPDYGAGISDTDFFDMPLRKGQVSKRIVYFHQAVKSVFWQYPACNGSANGAGIRLRFIPLSKNFAISHIRQKILRNRLKMIQRDSAVGSSSFEQLWPVYEALFRCNTGVINYQQWIEQQEGTLWADSLLNQDLVFSVIVPVYNTESTLLNAAVHSVVQQSYGNWQLILVDDASTNAETLSTLAALEKCDPRIEVIRRKANGHICRATNDGIALARGEYVVFLDHDDELAPQALNEFAHKIAQQPGVRFIYSDEDLMSESGERLVPHFKSDWNPDLLLSHNYVTHLACYRSDLLSELGGVRVGYEGAQDYDLVLRVMSSVPAAHIAHIPKVLYHWRMVEGSTALDSGAKSYATEAGLRAVQDYLRRSGLNAEAVHDMRTNFYRVRYALPKVLPKVSVIIPTRDGLQVLKPCIQSVLATAEYPLLELVIVDNGSAEPETLVYLQQMMSGDCTQLSGLPVSVRIVPDSGDFNFSRLINKGAEHATGDVLLLLNNDTEAVQQGWLQEMLQHVCRQDIGCVGAKLLYPDMTIQHAGVILGLGGYAAHSHRGSNRYEAGYFVRAQVVQNMSAVTAACLMVRRDVFTEVNGFSESYAVAYNDVDFCLKVLSAGYRNLYTPFAELIHYESKTRGEDTSPEKQSRLDTEKLLLLQGWQELLARDPYYNPNLTRSREDFSLRADAHYEVE